MQRYELINKPVEDIQLNLFAAIYLSGALQGLILTLVFVINKDFNRRSNRYLALLLLTFTTLNIWGITGELALLEHYPIIHVLPLYFFSIIPPLTFLLIKHLTQSNYQISKWAYLLFLPSIADLCFQGTDFVRYLTGHFLTEEQFIQHYQIKKGFEIIAIFLTLGVLVDALRTLAHYEQNLYSNFADINDKSLRWLRNLLIGGLGLTLLWLYSALGFFLHFKNYTVDRIVWIGLSILIYWIGYMMLLQHELFLSDPLTSAPEPAPEVPKLSSKTEEHYQNLLRIMKHEELFRETDVSMDRLAQSVGLSKGYLSQIINQKEGKNFFEFINAYRIEDVQRKMRDAAYDHYSILGIAYEAGFKSKSTFNAVFKKVTHTTPSAYRKKAKSTSLNTST